MRKELFVVLGAGESGVGTAVLAKKKGYEVFVSDQGKIKQKYKDVLLHFDISWEEEKHSTEKIMAASEVMKSPGIPDKSDLVKQIHKKGIPVISEIEFAARYTKAKLVGISGSNGKTTTTLLTYHILKKGGLNVGLAGNVGKSFAMQVAENDYDYYVLELSSFQLDGMFKTKLNIAVMLNITPDHLDRSEYQKQNEVDSKMRIINNQTPDDVFIYNWDDDIIRREIEKRNIKSRLMPFSLIEKLDDGASLEDSKIVIKTNQNRFDMSIEELALHGKHNIANSMAAGIIARVEDLRKDVIRESLSDFKNAEHRLEFVTKIHDVVYVNDSKATNVNSTWFALESIHTPVIWIVGGVDKGNDYSMLFDLVKDKVKFMICLGKNNTKIMTAFGFMGKEMIDVKSVEEAVSIAYYRGEKGDTVLLSPACASFDLFENYEDRGYKFKQAVRSL
jgi:UDP-N-acetylmuramoylalanine--D-glutamate ligase